MSDCNSDVFGKNIVDSIDEIIKFGYETCFPSIRHLVLSNSGNEEDAKDIFQESMLAVFKKLSKQQVSISCKLNTYVYSVARLMWLKELNKRKKQNLRLKDSEDFIDLGTDFFDEYENNEKEILLGVYLKELSLDCQKILRMFLEGLTVKTITRKMGYSSEQHTKNRRYRCKTILILKIRKNPQYKELKNGKDGEDREVPRW